MLGLEVLSEKMSYWKQREELFMAKNAVINFRVEKKLKNEMEMTCRSMGMNMTTAFNLFCRKVVSEKRIPFEMGMEKAKGKA